MPLYVAFQKPSFAGSDDIGALGKVRASESISAGASGAVASQDGEIAVLSNTEAVAVYVAHGKTPDASATTSTAETSARYCVPAGQNFVPVDVKTGDSFAVASV